MIDGVKLSQQLGTNDPQWSVVIIAINTYRIDIPIVHVLYVVRGMMAIILYYDALAYLAINF